MLKPAIVTIPITPREAPKIGLLLIPFVMDVISKKMGIYEVMSLSVSGSKLLTGNTENHVQKYLQANRFLGINPSFIWRDDQKENIYWINIFFEQLQANGFITKSDQLLLRCSCRAVETLASAENYSSARKLYTTRNKITFCKICKKSIRQEMDAVYLFRIPDHSQISTAITNWDILPEFTKLEITNLMKDFKGTKLLVSKTRPSAIPLWIGRDHIFLDVDFGWQLILPIIRRFGYDPKILVGSQKNLLGCFLIMLLSHLIDETSSTLIVPGYCVSNKESDQILNLFLNWEKAITRIFLACHCTFKKKDWAFNVSLLKLIRRAMKELPTDGKSRELQLSLGEAINECEGMPLRKLLASKQYKHHLFADLLM